MKSVYWWEPYGRKTFRICNGRSIFNGGRREEEVVKYPTTHFTKHGIVYSAAIPHDERLLKSEKRDYLNYYTHYAMFHSGKLWRGKSWGGGFGSKALSRRANKFARDVMRLTQDEADALPVSPSKQAELEILALKDCLRRLVDLVLSLVETTLPRVGIVWSSPADYPVALREALKVIGKGGAIEKAK